MILDATPMLDLALEGTVVAVAADRGHHFSKRPQCSIVLVEEHGEDGARWRLRSAQVFARRRPRFPNLRQVHLIPHELFDTLRALGYDVYPGELGENITTAGLELERLPVGTIIRLGDTAAIELTGLRTPCVLIERFRRTAEKDDRESRRASIQMRDYGHCHRGRRGGSGRHGACCAAAAAMDSTACPLKSRAGHRPTRARCGCLTRVLCVPERRRT
jgi:hypothetical protein